MQAALAPLSAYGGNLIVTLDFFRAGAKYYKTTERVDAVDLGVAGIAALPFKQRLVLLKSVAHSLKILHDLHIVHGDLKPDNVLVKRTELGYTSKLIDFDSSYVAGRPPAARRDRRHDQLLLARAAGLHPGGRGRAGASSATASDVVRARSHLQRVPHRAVPRIRPAYGEPSVAARSGAVLRVDRAGLDPVLADLVDRMMLAAPAERPTIARCTRADGAARPGGGPGRGCRTSGGCARARSSGLRGKLVGRAAPRPPAGPETAGSRPASGLKGKLWDAPRARTGPTVPADTGTWLCPVCEGVNHGGRVCSTCGERLPDGFVPADSVAGRPPLPPLPWSCPRRALAARRVPRRSSGRTRSADRAGTRSGVSRPGCRAMRPSRPSARPAASSAR